MKIFWKGDNVQLALALPGRRGYWEIGLTRGNTGRGEVFLWSVPDGAEARETAARIGLEIGPRRSAETDRLRSAHSIGGRRAFGRGGPDRIPLQPAGQR